MAGDEEFLLTSVALNSQPFDVAFHPARPCMAVGKINGAVEMISYGPQEDEAGASAFASLREWEVSAHQESCRAVRFVQPDGSALLSASSDKSMALLDVESGRVVHRIADAHSDGITRIMPLSDWSVASGDDAGGIKLWDLRERNCCSSFSPHDDFVSDLVFDQQTSRLLSTSGDGTLAVHDTRRGKLVARSENAEDELLSAVIVKNRRKVLVGSQSGVLLLYSWGHFNDCSDRFPGHPASVDALLKFDEDTVLTGSSDGLIRIISVLPNKMLGVVGVHSDDPIERLAVSPDMSLLASASHDNTVKLWDLSFLHEEDGDEDEEKGGNEDKDEDDDDDGAAAAEEEGREAEEREDGVRVDPIRKLGALENCDMQRRVESSTSEQTLEKEEEENEKSEGVEEGKGGASEGDSERVVVQHTGGEASDVSKREEGEGSKGGTGKGAAKRKARVEEGARSGAEAKNSEDDERDKRGKKGGKRGIKGSKNQSDDFFSGL